MRIHSAVQKLSVGLLLAALPSAVAAQAVTQDPKAAQDQKPAQQTNPTPEPKPAPTDKPAAEQKAASQQKPANEKPAADKPAPDQKPTPEQKPAPEKTDPLDAPRALFNGQDLTGWQGDPEHWAVEDGAIVGSTTKAKPLKKGPTSLIWQGGEPENFELSLKYRFPDHANHAALQFRGKLLKDVSPWTVAGYQFDFGGDGRITGNFTEERSRGLLAEKGQKVVVQPSGDRLLIEQFATAADLAAVTRPDDWNDAVVRCVGNRIVFELNGVKIMELVDHQADKRALKGIVSLELPAAPAMKVQFKDITVKELPAGSLVNPAETPVPPDAKDLNLEAATARLVECLRKKDAKALESLRLVAPKMEPAELTATLLARLTQNELEGVTVVDVPKDDRSKWDQAAKQLKAHWSGPFHKAAGLIFKNGGTLNLPLSHADGQWRLASLIVRSGLRSGDGRPNLAFDGQASASSEETSRGNVAAGALDGQAETLWCAATGNENEWWQIDLGTERHLTGCQLEWENPASVFRYRVDGSYDGHGWNPLAEGTKSESAANAKHDFSTPARYLRVTFFGCWPAGWAALREARVFGEKDDLQPSPVAPEEPLTPGGRYKKHDMNRPRPMVVAPPNLVSPQEPATPPSDATVLFDGHDLSKWRFGTKPDGPIESKEPKWKVENGCMEVTPAGGMVFSREKFADSQIHIEWATPAVVKGNGQGRGNSGVFIHGHPEIQVLDSYDNDTYPDGQASAVYLFYPPLVNATRKPGEWQTYDIVYIAPRLEQGHVVKPATFTVFLNGVLVQNTVEVPGAAVECSLGLQDHGNPVRYRNIWFRRL